MTWFKVPGREKKDGRPLLKPVAPADLTVEPYADVVKAIKKHIPEIAKELEKLLGPNKKVHTVDIVLKIDNWSFEEEK